ncbi:dihydropteroate synthase [bacterium]|nr:dihydropteroate synthase [bacterium]
MSAGAGSASGPGRPRLLAARGRELRALLEAAGVDAYGAALMARKAESLVVRVDDLRAPAANILKQELLSLGGDCATHRDVILGGPERSSAHLIGSERQLAQLPAKLKPQPFGLRRVGEDLAALLAARRRPPKALTLPGGALSFEAGPRLMGILNVTPDSFSDGGACLDPERAVEQGLRLIAEGADLIDIGGESTRPGAAPVAADEETRRVLPVIRALARQTAAPLSVDTRKASVAAEALAAGAQIINDVSALGDPAMAAPVAASGAGLVLMHMQGEPATMQASPQYADAVDEIYRWLEAKLAAARAAGIAGERLLADPGIGFGKRLEDNLAILRRLEEFHGLGVSLVLGASRKSFLGALLEEPDPGRRLEGSLAAAARAAAAGVQILRVHDVAATRRFLAAWRPLAPSAGAIANDEDGQS